LGKPSNINAVLKKRVLRQRKAAGHMKVAVLDNIRIVERPEPKPGPRDVLVRLRAASLNFRDLVVVDGGYGARQKKRDLVMLSDGAGEIVELGSEVASWRVGDRDAAVRRPHRLGRGDRHRRHRSRLERPHPGHRRCELVRVAVCTRGRCAGDCNIVERAETREAARARRRSLARADEAIE